MIRAVVVCEDPTRDMYVIKPVMEQIFDRHGRKVSIQFASRNVVRGVQEALDESKLKEVRDTHPMAKVFFVIVDRDCVEARHDRLQQRLRDAELDGATMFGCLAAEELEVWPLALHRKRLKEDWDRIRSDCNPKENYFDQFIAARKWETDVGRGRKAAMAELRAKWDALKNSCPEVAELELQVGRWLEDSAIN